MKLVDVPDPEPGPGEVKIVVQAAGICNSESFSFFRAVYPFPAVARRVRQGRTGGQAADGADHRAQHTRFIAKVSA